MAKAFEGAAKVFKAEFRSDYGYHAQMEPLSLNETMFPPVWRALRRLCRQES